MKKKMNANNKLSINGVTTSLKSKYVSGVCLCVCGTFVVKVQNYLHVAILFEKVIE